MTREPGTGEPLDVEAVDEQLPREVHGDEPPGPPAETGSGKHRSGHPRSVWSDRSFWKRAGRASVVIWLGNAAILASTAVLAHTLTVPALGAVVLATSVVSVISSLLDITLDEAVLYHGIRAHVDGRNGELKGILRAAVVLDLLIGVAITVLILVAAGPIARFAGRGELDPDLVRLASLIMLATTVDGSTGAALFIVGKAHLRATMLGASGILRLALVLVVAPSRSQAAVVVSYAGAAALAAAIQVVLAWRLAWRPLAGTPTQGTLRTWARPLARFGMHTSVTTTMTSAEAGIVPIVLARSAGVQEAAMLAIATLPVTVVLVASSALRLMLLPEQARLSATGAGATLRRVIRQYVRVALAIGVAGAIAGWLLLPTLIPALYSERYEAAVGPARILLIGAIARLATIWSKNFAAAIGRPHLRTWTAGLELTLVVGVLTILASRGAEGAAWALSISYAVMAVLWCVMAHVLLPRAERDGADGAVAAPPAPGQG